VPHDGTTPRARRRRRHARSAGAVSGAFPPFHSTRRVAAGVAPFHDSTVRHQPDRVVDNQEDLT
jgi:hypothetical protein